MMPVHYINIIMINVIMMKMMTNVASNVNTYQNVSYVFEVF